MKQFPTWNSAQNYIQKTLPKTNEIIKNSLSFHILKISIKKLKLKKKIIQSGSKHAVLMCISCIHEIIHARIVC